MDGSWRPAELERTMDLYLADAQGAAGFGCLSSFMQRLVPVGVRATKELTIAARCARLDKRARRCRCALAGWTSRRRFFITCQDQAGPPSPPVSSRLLHGR